MSVEKKIPEKELDEVWFGVRHEAFEQLASIFRNYPSLTQKELAERLGMDEGQLSRVMRGRTNITLRTLCNIAYAMRHKARVDFVPFDQLPSQNSDFEELNQAVWGRGKVRNLGRSGSARTLMRFDQGGSPVPLNQPTVHSGSYRGVEIE